METIEADGMWDFLYFFLLLPPKTTTKKHPGSGCGIDFQQLKDDGCDIWWIQWRFLKTMIYVTLVCNIWMTYREPLRGRNWFIFVDPVWNVLEMDCTCCSIYYFSLRIEQMYGFDTLVSYHFICFMCRDTTIWNDTRMICFIYILRAARSVSPLWQYMDTWSCFDGTTASTKITLDAFRYIHNH